MQHTHYGHPLFCYQRAVLCCCATMMDPMAHHQRKAIRKSILPPKPPRGLQPPNTPTWGALKFKTSPPPPRACPAAGQGVAQRAARATKRCAPPAARQRPVRPPLGAPRPAARAALLPALARLARAALQGSLVVFILAFFSVRHIPWLSFTHCRGPAGRCSA